MEPIHNTRGPGPVDMSRMSTGGAEGGEGLILKARNFKTISAEGHSGSTGAAKCERTSAEFIREPVCLPVGTPLQFWSKCWKHICLCIELLMSVTCRYSTNSNSGIDFII